MRHLGVRWKLTLWYGGVLAVVLTVFSGAVYWTMRHHLLGRIDQGLHEELAELEAARVLSQDEMEGEVGDLLFVELVIQVLMLQWQLLSAIKYTL